MTTKNPAPYLKSKQTLLGIEWAKDNKWDVRFIDPDLPKQFTSFFPAQSVIEPVFDLNEYSFSIGNSQLDVIDGYKAPSLSVTFYDSHNCELEKFFENWVNSKMLGNFKNVLPIESMLKMFEVYRYNNFGKKVWSTLYKICPRGTLKRDHTSSAGFVIFTVEFIIASMTRN